VIALGASPLLSLCGRLMQPNDNQRNITLITVVPLLQLMNTQSTLFRQSLHHQSMYTKKALFYASRS
jgi:hypothetical protein